MLGEVFRMAFKTVDTENITPEMVTAFFDYRGLDRFPVGLLKRVLEVAPEVEVPIADAETRSTILAICRYIINTAPDYAQVYEHAKQLRNKLGGA